MQAGNQRGSIAVAKPSKPIDLRDRLRGLEPASQDTEQQMDVSQSAWGFPSRRRRRHR